MHLHSKHAQAFGLTVLVGILAFFIGAKFAPGDIIEMCEGAVNEINKGWK